MSERAGELSLRNVQDKYFWKENPRSKVTMLKELTDI